MFIHSELCSVTSFNSSTRRRGVSALIIICVLLFAISGCGIFSRMSKPTSAGEDLSGYTYVPIDPNKVQIKIGENSSSYDEFLALLKSKNITLLDTLPDNAVRMSMELSDAQGNVTYGVAKIGASGSIYKLTADYVNSDTVNKNVWIRKTMIKRTITKISDKQGTKENVTYTTENFDILLGSTYQISRSAIQSAEEELVPGSEQYEVKSFPTRPSEEVIKQLRKDNFQEFNVPIYVGIGLRIIAQGVSMQSDASISGIGVVGAEADAKRISGSLIVQTLGVNSQAVASALPVQSELSRTTAENAFVAIGSIKAMLHQKETDVYPRVVGLYLPFAGGKRLVNALISELSSNPVTWCPICFDKEGQQPH